MVAGQPEDVGDLLKCVAGKSMCWNSAPRANSTECSGKKAQKQVDKATEANQTPNHNNKCWNTTVSNICPGQRNNLPNISNIPTERRERQKGHARITCPRRNDEQPRNIPPNKKQQHKHQKNHKQFCQRLPLAGGRQGWAATLRQRGGGGWLGGLSAGVMGSNCLSPPPGI